jgi:membrane associated rhomboid family serine protease
MPILYENLTKPQADLCGLVLASSGILFRLSKDRSGIAVWVSAEEYERARQCMGSYFSENRSAPPFPDKRWGGVSVGTILANVIAAAVLLVFYSKIAGAGIEQKMTDLYGSSARAIVGGDIYRGVTSLMLHADMTHLAGNMAGIILFGTAVCAVCGWGVGWLMILMSGVAGHLINAYMYESGHISIGASTAVFGAIGILSGYQLISSQRFHHRGLASWAPLACGLALLGLFGSGPHSDIAAHFFGFAAGAALGLCYAMAVRHPLKLYIQIISICLVFFMIAISWFAGWRGIA